MLFLYLTSVVETILTKSEHLEKHISDVAKGNTDAIGHIYDSTSASVFAYALSILKNKHDAEDILHECYISIWNSAVNYTPEGKPMAWIMTIARNLCYMRLRRHKTNSFLPIEDAVNVLDDNEEATLEDKIVLKECLLSLSDEEREIVLLHAVSGFRHREIAEMLELPLPTVLSKYSRALHKLKREITKGER